MDIVKTKGCYCCGGQDLSKTFVYDKPPKGETRFSFSDRNYHREIVRCSDCGHFMSIHDMDDSELYEQDYVNSTYGDGGFQRTYERIISLGPVQSDNVGRCNRIVQFAENHFSEMKLANPPPKILDVGSGLCVFLHRMKAHGWRCTALDPDPRAMTHARNVVGVDAICGDFFEVDVFDRFDAVSFNKVLEHVPDPVMMLQRSREYLASDGFVYIELPDGEIAAKHGPGREEFFVEHHHAFSLTSLSITAMRAGFVVRCIERLQEPSQKFTLRAFLV